MLATGHLALTLAVATALGCGGDSRPVAGAGLDPVLGEAVDVASSFAPGATYEVRSETGTVIDSNAVGTTEVRVIIDSERNIRKGGTFGRDGLEWVESVERVRVEGEIPWDSQTHSPPPADLVDIAALSGAEYTVAIGADGRAAASGLKVPMSALSPEQRDAMKSRIGDLERVASGLAASLASSLRSLPSRRFRVGERWTHESDNPSVAPDAVVAVDWTLTRLADGIGHFTIAGGYQSSTLDRSPVSGSAEYDIERGQFRAIDMKSELALKDGRGKVVTHSRIRVSQR